MDKPLAPLETMASERCAMTTTYKTLIPCLCDDGMPIGEDRIGDVALGHFADGEWDANDVEARRMAIELRVLRRKLELK